MLKVVLTDGSVITNCLVGTTTDSIIHGGETYAEAAEILDVITPENSSLIRVYNENDEQIAIASDLMLNPGGTIGEIGGYKTCTVTLRHKTELEKMHDEIAELQEAIIEG